MLRRCTLTLVATLVACAPAEDASVDTAGALASLRQADSAYAATANTRDREAAVAMYTDDAVVYPPDAATMTGHAGVRQMVDGFMNDSAFAASFTHETARVSDDGSMGYTVATADVTFTGPDGKQMTEKLRDVHIWKRQPDGSWKILVDVWNMLPGAAPAASARTP